jgi:putative component of membrane protein insertase Oxa1/YidC/SpoIIIJ protein YidD
MLKQAALSAIRWYQRMGGSKQLFSIECNFTPTCSEYTHQAISKYGVMKGTKLGWQRIRRCSDPDCICIKPDPLK